MQRNTWLHNVGEEFLHLLVVVARKRDTLVFGYLPDRFYPGTVTTGIGTQTYSPKMSELGFTINQSWGTQLVAKSHYSSEDVIPMERAGPSYDGSYSNTMTKSILLWSRYACQSFRYFVAHLSSCPSARKAFLTGASREIRRISRRSLEECCLIRRAA